ncbi:ATP-binding protein [Flavobacterium johnsoniae]|jgi:AAA+ superfamily predicted ATPase|uniref:AAA ATPase, central domain protein n=1 Tax=Flavobacterium johnsoniae (strain ATCC 17061 / DSM 2064 / JCM 8514 / BCRC 14874 / CCUG 350202 / NBRC 14942 / NCIMB 11054 / UW101) TaxID=376686 RepID=A5FF43_FLAJ1|nr:ATP-binding protein [Flavobacterium johnsoniae]ABQ06185.1 AAA ATPase, central domain protein [Flavobacterium johnsoniae UW101]OXE98343.1 AAA family ATPase [Flavobacterium johnsoniae UW101]WQG81931.1 ATP-binding protein [Flavobacterium johnsoniae UW101]SHK68236.1 ATPase family associated with various cellular activities (AAA) [Flavobacterium johnsoniae]
MENVFTYIKNQFVFQLDTLFQVENPMGKPILNQIDSNGFIDEFIIENNLTEIDILILGLALVPHVKPDFLSSIIAEYLPNGGELPEFGGIKTKNHRGILPTGETAQFLIAGNDLDNRILFYNYLHNQSFLYQKGIIKIDSVPNGEPKLSGLLILEDEYIEKFITGKILKPQLSSVFPAQLIETQLDWNDLVLNSNTLNQIKEIETWLKFNEILFNDWNMKSKIKPGFRVMFYGAPGTGKTLTASLLGKYTKRDVYRIDLSMIISKYIGETEKNLSSLFDKASDKDWILFFDEADAIFGKRTNVRDAHDKYANQEVSYLLQRIENHPGLVILASNFKTNIDAAFTRRFQSIIEFEVPSYGERLQLWQNNLPKGIKIAEDVNLNELSKKYDITGANIVNIIQYACLRTLEDKNESINLNHLLQGIKKEYAKEGKMM